jgi:hypothetical protein
MKNLLQECVEIIYELAGNDYLYFNDAVEVRTSPHSNPFLAWAVCVSPSNNLYIMDADQQWHQADYEDLNASLVIGSLYQRLQLMRMRYARAS